MNDPESILSGIVEKIGEKASDLVQSLPGPAAAPAPEVLAAPNPKAAMEAALSSMQVVLAASAKDALAKLGSVSPKLAEEGAKILQSMVKVGTKLATGAIDKASAELAIDNYLAALQLLGMAEVNTAKVQAFLAASKTLTVLKSVLLALVQVGVSFAAPAVGAWLGSLNLDKILDSLFPKVE